MNKYYLIKEIAGMPVEKIEISEDELNSIPNFTLISQRMSGKSDSHRNMIILQQKIKTILDNKK